MKQPWLFKTHRRMINFRKTPFYFPLTKGDFKFFCLTTVTSSSPSKGEKSRKLSGQRGFNHMKKKLLFLSSYASHFVIDDLEILQKHFQVEKLILAGKSRSGFQKLCNTIEIFFAVFRNELVFCWFADFSAFLAVLFSKIFNKKSIVMIGGYETSNLPNYGGLQSRSAKYIKYSLKKANRIITVSKFIAKEINDLNLCQDAYVIHLAILPEKVKKQKQKKTTDQTTRCKSISVARIDWSDLK